jgi:hypothetical protein
MAYRLPNPGEQTAPAPGGGLLDKIKWHLTGSPAAQAAGMVNPVGAVLPGMISESRLVPMLLKIMREKGLDPARAESMLMDAVTSGKIDPGQFKTVFEALKRATGSTGGAQAARFMSETKAMPAATKIASSVAPGGAEAAGALKQPISEVIRALQSKFSGGK